MNYRVQTYEGLRGAGARRRVRVGLQLQDDGQILWGPWLDYCGYTTSEKTAVAARDRVDKLAADLNVNVEYEMPLRED